MLNRFKDFSIILASGSPRRKKLLQQIGFTFEVSPADIDEGIYKETNSPGEYAQRNAKLKAFEISKKVSHGIIIGADTVVAIDGKVFGKPENNADAVRMLEKLSGCEHTVITALSVIKLPDSKEAADFAATRVKFKSLSDNEINEYVRSGEPMGKAGAYGIQEKGALLVDEIHGCYYNVVGLPLTLLIRLMDEVIIKR